MRIVKQRGGSTALESARIARGDYADEYTWNNGDDERQEEQQEAQQQERDESEARHE